MPNKPTPKRKPWTQDRVKHQRTKDMRWFYNDRRWRKFSKRFKEKNPCCIECKKKGLFTPATVTDHKEVYEVNPKGFNLNDLKEELMQPLCNKCHAIKSGKERHIK